jgi:hypothetical protein
MSTTTMVMTMQMAGVLVLALMWMVASVQLKRATEGWAHSKMDAVQYMERAHAREREAAAALAENVQLRKQVMELVDRVTLMQQAGLVAQPGLGAEEEQSWTIDNEHEVEIELARKTRRQLERGR